MRYDVKANKSLAFEMSLKYKSFKVPSKKKYHKKRERRNNKVKYYLEEY